MNSWPPGRRQRYYAALDYMHDAQAALTDAAELLLVAECNADAAGE